MKTSITIGIITASLALSCVAVEKATNAPSSPVSSPVSSVGKGMTAIQRAAEAKQYIFVFLYEKEDEATKNARKTFENYIQKANPAVQSVAVNRASPDEKDLVDKFGLERAPMPLVLAVAPNGAITGGLKASEMTEDKLREVIVSAGMQKCLKALQDGKIVMVCLQNSSTKANDAAMKGVNDFKADAQFGSLTEIVTIDPVDAKESRLLTQLKADPQTKEAITAFLAPPGIVVAKVNGATSKEDFLAALKKASSGCAPGSACAPGACPPSTK